MADVNIDPESTDSKQLFNQGVKAFVLRDYKNAVDALGRATEIMVSELGDDLHDSLGDSYLYYGKALLALYRQESDPIGNLPKELSAAPEDQEPEEDEDEEADNEENEDKDGTGESGDAAEKEEEAEKENGTQNGDETKDEKVDEDNEEDCLNVDEAEKSAAGEKDESFLQLDPAEPEADEEPTDLQVAWEVLELAKKIFHNRGESGKKAYAETLTTLGEISLESENYAAAINDFTEGLEIQIQIYPEDSRKVAETFYNIGVAFASNSSYKEGIAHLKKSIEYLERRIRNLEDKNESLDEVQEMKDLIPEIYERIRDLKSFTDEVCCVNCQCIDKLTVSFQKAKVREVLRKTYENLKENNQNSDSQRIENCLGIN